VRQVQDRRPVIGGEGRMGGREENSRLFLSRTFNAFIHRTRKIDCGLSLSVVFFRYK